MCTSVHTFSHIKILVAASRWLHLREETEVTFFQVFSGIDSGRFVSTVCLLLPCGLNRYLHLLAKLRSDMWLISSLSCLVLLL